MSRDLSPGAMAPATRIPPGSETASAIRSLLMPCLLLDNGRVMAPGPDGPVVARTPTGDRYDVLDVTDQLAARFGRVYVVDLDGIEHDRPQLDYLQEISRATETWIDAGVRSSEQAIDIVVAGAFRTVVSSAYLESASELEKTWKLSSEIAFEVELDGGRPTARAPEWREASAIDIARAARSVGPAELVVSPRGHPVDWEMIRQLASGGPVWVDGTFEADEVDRIRSAGATGGIFHISEELGSEPS
ncbi:MAG TPA: HisA/HisF-related TIM barrel protein [Thermoplasmata archaeon]|nr:HisA/HisF-related TIM barrel protein [Thermoplasmata archaeon]